jgi:hypothetical protein
MSVTLSFIDERQFLTVILPVLPLHECVDLAPTESAAEPLHSIAGSTIAEEPAADPATVESVVVPLLFVANPVGSGAALTNILFMCSGLNPLHNIKES